MTNRLIIPPRSLNLNLIPDLLVVLMANVEEALVSTGAKPGIDYDHSDLMAAASPFVASMFNSPDSHVVFVTDWDELELKP